MREQLSKYIELLFAGTADTDEIQQEILQNSLDRFDDLVAQGKSPEAAYRLTIGGIGDINEILDQQPPVSETPVSEPGTARPSQPQHRRRSVARSILWGGGTFVYLCLSLITRAWWISWLIFPMLACIQGIVTAIYDLKEANRT